MSLLSKSRTALVPSISKMIASTTVHVVTPGLRQPVVDFPDLPNDPWTWSTGLPVLSGAITPTPIKLMNSINRDKHRLWWHFIWTPRPNHHLPFANATDHNHLTYRNFICFCKPLNAFGNDVTVFKPDYKHPAHSPFWCLHFTSPLMVLGIVKNYLSLSPCGRGTGWGVRRKSRMVSKTPSKSLNTWLSQNRSTLYPSARSHSSRILSPGSSACCPPSSSTTTFLSKFTKPQHTCQLLVDDETCNLLSVCLWDASINAVLYP